MPAEEKPFPAAEPPSDRSIPGGLGRLVDAGRGDVPAVTFVDSARGERVELGHATLANWADKIANLLTLELELEAGSVLPVDLGSHWTTLAVLVGAWRAGVVVALGDQTPSGPAAVREDRLPSGAADDRTIVVGTGIAARLTADAGDGLGLAEEGLAMPDEFPPVEVAASHPALSWDGRTVTHGALASAAQAAADLAGLPEGGRLATVRAVDTLEGLVTGPLAAWSARASLVLGTDPDRLEALARQERATAILDDGVGAEGEAERVAVGCDMDAEGALRVRPG